MNPEVFFGLSKFPNFREKIDSLRRISELNTPPLLPFLEQGKIGFMDLKGFPILKPNYHSLLKQELLCQTLQTDIIGVSNTSGVKQLINRAGTPIYSGSITTYEDLGFGFIKIKEPTEIKNDISAKGIIKNNMMKKYISLVSPVPENILLFGSLFHLDYV